MIADSSLSPYSHEWKIELGKSFRQLDDLLAYCQLDRSASTQASSDEFPFRVTRHYASLIEKGNANDPLLLQVLPDSRESLQVDGYSSDAVGDQQAMQAPGLIHKYRSRVLLTVTPACAIHCRYCFRRHFPYTDNRPDFSLDSDAMRYLSSHDEIHEVILSGGDPLMLDDHKLLHIIKQLNHIPHIHLLRIHSRLLSVLPHRVTESLIATLQQFDGQVILVSHINHANELDDVNRQLFKDLGQQGFLLFNQSVLLNNINNDYRVLQALSYRLIDCGITPYYLHRLDRVQGAAHFDLEQQQACDIYHKLRDNLPGYLLPRMVSEIPGRLSKSTVHCR